jgi:hypothetical protein
MDFATAKIQRLQPGTVSVSRGCSRGTGRETRLNSTGLGYTLLAAGNAMKSPVHFAGPAQATPVDGGWMHGLAPGAES